MDPYSQALSDFYYQHKKNKLILHNSYGVPEQMPVEVFFREEEDMPELEIYALSLAQGKVLDIGAGVGNHTLILQEWGMAVSALEVSPEAVEIMKERGVEKVINEDIFNFNSEKFDTLLLLMNGIGVSGSLEGLRRLLDHLKGILYPGGQLIFDSSNIKYLYKDIEQPKEKYYGEIAYQYEYKTIKGDWFKWLYIDQEVLSEVALEKGWIAQIVYEDNQDQYLARLVLA